jgi:hypothetical protein
MLHDFLDVDKSPLLSLSKKGLAKASFAVTIGMISLSVGTGLLPLTVAGVSNTHVASAQAISGTVDLGSTWKNTWRGVFSGYFRQTYFGYIYPSNSDYINRIYGTSAEGVARRVCTDLAIQATRSDATAMRLNSWWLIVPRYEGGRYNCFVRKYIY